MPTTTARPFPGTVLEAVRRRYLRDMRTQDVPTQPSRGSEEYDETTGIATISNGRGVLATYRATGDRHVVRLRRVDTALVE